MSQGRIAAIGMFDGVHSGHRLLLRFLHERAKERGLREAVITFNSHPLELVRPEIAPRLLMTASEKLAALRAAGVEDIILLQFDEALRQMTAGEFMRMLHDAYAVDCLVVGYDHRFGHDRSQGFEDYVRMGSEFGMDILRAPEQEGVSSTLVRKALEEGRVGDASALLGHPFYIDGTVVAGKRLGRTIGFPTANLSPVSPQLLIPARGVYVADVSIDGASRRLRSMLNIGHRPTVDREDAPDTIEVHVLGYDGDLYGHMMRVHFLHRLRSERVFPDIEALRLQLCADREAALRWQLL